MGSTRRQSKTSAAPKETAGPPASAQAGAGWVRGADGIARFHLGAWLAASGWSQSALASELGVHRSHVLRCVRYACKVGNYSKQGKDKGPFGLALFRLITTANYGDYLSSYEHFHDEYEAMATRTRTILSQVLPEFSRQRGVKE